MNTVWLVGYYTSDEASIEIGGVFSTREGARQAAWKAHGRHRHVFHGPLELDENLPLGPTEWPDIEWVDNFNFLIVGDFKYAADHHEHYWGPYGSNVVVTSNSEVHRRLSAIDRKAPTTAWLCKSASDHNWQELAIMLGMRNIEIRPLNCDHE